MTETQNNSIGVIGTGNFARAIAKRLYYSGYHVVIGSRRPSDRYLSSIDDCFCDITVKSVLECIQSADILFLAIHFADYADCLSKHIPELSGKIVIDVSNRDRPSETESNAEFLSSLIPDAKVVKAFNVLSAYAIEEETAGGSRRVFLAGNDTTARSKVSVLAREMGFYPVDLGLLKSSRKIERFPIRLFPEWRGPVAFSIAVFNIWYLYIVYIYFVERSAFSWEQIFIKVSNKPLCMTAITVLSATYLPSSIASMFQIFYGTKHMRFPYWFDKWLKSRKQLGILAFILVTVHVIISVLLMSPTYWRSWYHPIKIVVSKNLTEDLELPMVTWMIWKGEAACLTGILAFLCLCILAVTTIPSVADTLNWKEWQFIQSKLGHVSLFLSIVHVVIMGAPGWAKGDVVKTLKSITFLSLILPVVTLTLKIIFTFPCLNRYVTKIRRGWERNKTGCKAKCSKPYSSGYVVSKKETSKLDFSFDTEASQMIQFESEACECHMLETV